MNSPHNETQPIVDHMERSTYDDDPDDYYDAASHPDDYYDYDVEDAGDGTEVEIIHEDAGDGTEAEWFPPSQS